MKKKLIFLFLVIAAVLAVLIGRIMYIQYVKGATYEKIVLSLEPGLDTSYDGIKSESLIDWLLSE